MASFSHHQQQQQRRAISPHRTMVWTEPNNESYFSGCRNRKVPIVYYLCREDGQLEHPHFMEVPPRGAASRLCLRDFTERLDMLRGEGMAAMYSWSSKRSYRNKGFVWHDLTEDDTIHPAHANEECVVLKGSHRFSTSHIIDGRRIRKQSSSSFDLPEYKQQQVSLLGTDDEISPPLSSSSPGDTQLQETTLITGGGRMRASSVLMQLISCGSSVTSIRSHSRQEEEKETSNKNNKGIMPSEEGRDERDYFSGSLVETNKNKKNTATTAALLKRSSSCNAADNRRLDRIKEEDARSGARRA